MFKKIISIVLSLIIVSSIGTVAFAQDTIPEYEVAPCYEYTSQASNALTINSSTGVATYSCSVDGYRGTTTKISVTMTLQKKVLFWWSEVDTYTKTVSDYYIHVSDKYTLSDSGTYRAKADITVYSNSNSEEITCTSQQVSY